MSENSRKWQRSSDALVEKFHERMAGFDPIERKKMFGYPCCFVKGNMFTGLHEENWVLRLPEEAREEILQSHKALPFEPMGRVMREYVILPKSILDSPDLLHLWIDKSFQFVSTLPQKVKKRKMKKKG